MLAGDYVFKRDLGGGRYTLKREIGRGGAATVYLARDERHERFVAIKVLHTELSHAIGAARFLREIKLTASLQHPHILPIHDSGESEEQLYYVMPYVEGDSLRQRLTADNRLSIEEAVRIGREVAGALAYAHERGIVHRDIKPENILFSGGHAVVADFGIARAIDRASEKITQQGTITGTPAYMSPEQARDRAFDGRSDVYSLACVMYEAMAGAPPFPGDTPMQQLQARLNKTPPPLSEYRHDVPPPIEAVIAKALATSPDDRYADARAFSAALSAAIGHSGETLTARAARRHLSRGTWMWAAGLTLAVLGVASLMPPVRDRIDRVIVRVDTAQFAVVPFLYVNGRTPDAAAEEPVAVGLYDALKRWDGLKLSSDASVTEALQRRGNGVTLIDEVTRLARSVRAGRVVWGRVVMAQHDSIVVRAALYDALTGASLREVTDTVPAAGGAAALRALDFRGIVAALLRTPKAEAISTRADRGTTSYAAWRAFERGATSLARWDVDAAIPALDSAVAADPAYPQANLWLAQAKSWRHTPATEWTPNFVAANKGRSLLDARERTLVDALGALSQDDYPSACDSYDALRTRDSLNVLAWLGLATCRGYDPAVVRAKPSPSGWAFRGSYEAAWQSLTRALELAPNAFNALPSDFIRQIARVEYNRSRTGQAGATQFFAIAEMVGDTVGYVPYPIAEFRLARSPATTDAALRFNRDRMLTLLEALTQRLPDSPDVFEAMALLLEVRDEISGTPSGRYSALSALERARALSVEPDQRLRLAAADVRLHLKLADFARASAIADSVLNAAHPGADASQLAALAAFAGRTDLATRYLIASDLSGKGVPAANSAVAALTMRAALGVCDDSLRALPPSIIHMLGSYTGSAERQSTV
ncbi:MAG TPA: protein kinase, partial [Gemmatimonadaceae bacterium]